MTWSAAAASEPDRSVALTTGAASAVSACVWVSLSFGVGIIIHMDVCVLADP